MCIVFLLVDIALMKFKMYILFVAESLMLVKNFLKVSIFCLVRSNNCGKYLNFETFMWLLNN